MHCGMPLGAGDATSLAPFDPDWPTDTLNADAFDRSVRSNSYHSTPYNPLFPSSKLFPALMKPATVPSAHPYQFDNYSKDLKELTTGPEEFPFMMAGTVPQPVVTPMQMQMAPRRPPSLLPEYKRRDEYSVPPPPLPHVMTRRTPGAPSDPMTIINEFEPREMFARKVFVGGLPIDVSEEEISQTFSHFGAVLVDWPRRPDNNGKESAAFSHGGSARYMTGYVFLVFEEERSVQALVRECHREGDRYYLFVSSPTMRDKPVQVRPWRLADMDWQVWPRARCDPRKTVFIGGVPRPTKARELAEVLNKLYGPVCYVGIDIDPELKYPKGAARVTFSTTEAFIAAISGRFVHIPHAESQKRVEIKPYVMDEHMCDECEGRACSARYAPYFCGDVTCLQYYCEQCWDQIHYGHSRRRGGHKPLVRLGDQTKLLPRPPHHNHSHQSSRGYSSGGRGLPRLF